MTTHIRQYLSRVLPWPPTGNPNAYKSIHYMFAPKDNPNGKKLPWMGSAVRTLDEMVELAERAMRNPSARDIYVCMATQKMAMPKQAANGRSWMAAVREQSNALELKSLFIDIDAGTKGYPSTAAAVQALAAFCDTASLPPPQVCVLSGSGGLHVYWVLNRPLSVPEWQPLADALAAAARQIGLQADLGCTVDSVRVLRLPGTRNFKADPPHPVELVTRAWIDEDYDVDEIRAILAPFAGAAPVTSGGMGSVLPMRAPLVAGANELGAGVAAREARPVILADVAPQCGFIGEALATGGATFDQTLWNLTTLISTFAVDGRTQAHEMAKGHPTYTAADTDALYDRKLRERDQKNLGWPKCAAIQNAGCAACAACPHLAAGLSPLHLGRNAPPPLAAADLPQGYLRDADGLVQHVLPADGGGSTFELLCSYPMIDGWLQVEPRALHFTTKIGRHAHNIQVPVEAPGRKETLQTCLARQGVSVQSIEAIRLMEFFVAWIKHLQTVKGAVIHASPFGWSVTNAKIDGFAYDGHVWSPGSSRPASHGDPVLQIQYAPTGALEPWTEAAKLITDQRRPALDAILAASFGSPLMRFTGHAGVVLSAYSAESGVGKSTSMQVAQAVWGDPQKAMQSLSDTQNAVMKKVGQLRNLPLFWDELKGETDTNKFVLIAFQMTQGKEKSRLAADASYREPGSWQTMLCVASNDSVLDFVARMTKTTTAGLLRVFEWTVTPGVTGQIAEGVASRLIAGLRDNYGHAGLAFAKFLGENHERVAREVAVMQDRLGKQLGATTDERFWVAGVTCLLAGARYANQLGLTDIDIKGLGQFLAQTFTAQRAMRAAQPVDMLVNTNVAGILTQFLKAQRSRNTLLTNRVLQGRGKPATAHVQVLIDASRLDEINVQLGRDDKTLRIAGTAFREWLGKHGYSPSIVIRAMENHFALRSMVGRLGGGTPFSCGTEQLFEVQLAGTELSDLVEDFTPATT